VKSVGCVGFREKTQQKMVSKSGWGFCKNVLEKKQGDHTPKRFRREKSYYFNEACKGTEVWEHKGGGEGKRIEATKLRDLWEKERPSIKKRQLVK